MQLLLDTNAFLKWVEDDPGLPRKARAVIADPDNECLVSKASAWEIAIKCGLGKLRLSLPAGRYVTDHVIANRFRLLDIELRHVARVESLAKHHRDPFDRLLIAQALEENLPVVTADLVFRKYGVKRIW
jgi:PIN domain nuclease of toxin-antitoxin system